MKKLIFLLITFSTYSQNEPVKAPSLIIRTTPTTSAGNYHLLSRNDFGVVEKISSDGYIQNQNSYNQSADVWINGIGRFDGGLNLTNLAPEIKLVGTQAGGKSYSICNSYISSDDFLIRNNTDNVNVLRFLPTGEAAFYSTVTASSFNGSATLTGIPTAPTAAVGTNTTQIATMEALQTHSSSGTYTPTLTNTANITSSTLNTAYYIRNGNLVTVTIAVQLTLTSTADTVFTFSLPVSGATVVNGIGQGNLTSGGGAVNAYGIVDTTNSTTAQLRIGSTAVTGSGAGLANIIFTYSL